MDNGSGGWGAVREKNVGDIGVAVEMRSDRKLEDLNTFGRSIALVCRSVLMVIAMAIGVEARLCFLRDDLAGWCLKGLGLDSGDSAQP